MRRPVKQSTQLRRLARRDFHRKPGSPVLPISRDQFENRLAEAIAVAARERIDENTREYYHHFASALSLVDAAGGAA